MTYQGYTTEIFSADVQLFIIISPYRMHSQVLLRSTSSLVPKLLLNDQQGTKKKLFSF